MYTKMALTLENKEIVQLNDNIKKKKVEIICKTSTFPEPSIYIYREGHNHRFYDHKSSVSIAFD